jgi:transposase
VNAEAVTGPTPVWSSSAWPSRSHRGASFSAFLGLAPRESSTGGKQRLGRIIKMGDRYLGKPPVVGSCASLRHRKGHNDALRRWASRMLDRKVVKYKFNDGCEVIAKLGDLQSRSATA